MDKLQIIWGDLDRLEAIENHVKDKAEKVLGLSPKITNYIVNLKTINSTKSAGVNTFAVNMEVRLPNHQDVRAEKQGEDVYQLINETQQAVIKQLRSKKEQDLI
jgi:ribosomal subunit interface protein